MDHSLTAPHATNPSSTPSSKSWRIFGLSLAALGVVYGDIGTSPLYAINEIMFGRAQLPHDFSNIVGAISLVIWSLSLVVAFKYVVLVLRADSDGEGGVFALYSLLYKLTKRGIKYITLLLILAAGLLFGDGIITPAISVLSAAEGLNVATPSFQPYIVPLTLAILTGLFVAQYLGTAKVGRVFGPIIVVWFVAIALLGLRQIIITPAILHAFSPLYALHFLFSHTVRSLFFTLGSVMLVLTGGEAMYADMGHFGKTPIRISWFSVVFPALILNYLGQGAFLLGGNEVVSDNVFYSLVPSSLIYPMVILATLATIIASQALISGAFSLMSQAVSLGLSPYVRIVHTHQDHEGQIYVPSINWILYIGCILLVLTFKSSVNLAAAYGLAVSGVMFMTSVAMIPVARYYWKWSSLKCLAVFVPLAVVDLSFLSANSLKFLEGGFIPLLIGLLVLFLLTTWRWGRKKITKTFRSVPVMTAGELRTIKQHEKVDLPGTVVVMTPDMITGPEDKIPVLKQILFNRRHLLSTHIIFLTVSIKKEPHIHSERYIIYRLLDSPEHGSITSVQLNFGYMEEINVEAWLETLSKEHLLHISEHSRDWIIEVLHERVLPGPKLSFLGRFRLNIFQFLADNTDSADQYFGLGDETNLSVEIIPVHC